MHTQPAPSSNRPILHGSWVLWTAGVFGVLVFLRFDVGLTRWCLEHAPRDPQGLPNQLLTGLRGFGEVLTLLIVAVVVRVYDRRWKRIILALLIAQLLANLAYNTGKFCVRRYRPHAAVERLGPLDSLQVGQTWIGWNPGNREEATRSFPSGHSAAAFALAGILACFYPKLRWMWWSLAAGCALSRVFHAMHWPSDCGVGAMVGYLATIVTLRLTRTIRLPAN